jgi:hypothetical protein
MANQVTLTFAGDADDLAAAAKKAEAATKGVGDQATKSSKDFEDAAGGSDKLTGRLGDLGNAVSGAGDAIDMAAGTLDALNDVQQAGAQKAQRLARAQNDVQQAQEDMAQATRDASQAQIDQGQAQIDATQANIDAKTATNDYNEAVREHGKNSLEAQQAALDLTQAQQDLRQANEDSAQYTRDASQATIDAGAAQLDLNDAQREANPPDLSKWSEQLQTYAPLLQGLVGIFGLVTAAQWAWNAAQLASPTTWIIAGIVALIAIIVLIATKTDWFQKAWKNSWRWIKDAASDTWDWLKKVPGWIGGAFAKVASFITLPFRTAFNFVADAWNNTVGRLSFTFPGWVPGIGGNSISVPHIPKFHSGGVVPGVPGSEVMTLLQAGERVSSATSSGGAAVIEIRGDGSAIADGLIEILSKAVRGRGGDVQIVLGGRSARTA